MRRESVLDFLAGGVAGALLLGCGGGGGFDTGDILIEPRTVILGWGQAQTFTASLPALGTEEFDWTITSSAGSVVKKASNRAKFFAGLSLGTYELEASLASDPSTKGRARVTIVDLRWLLTFGFGFPGADSHAVSSDMHVAAGSIYVAYNNSAQGNQVLKFDLSGNQLAQRGLDPEAGLQIVGDSLGHVYVSTDSGVIRKFDANLDEITGAGWSPPTESFAGPLALDSAGNVYAMNFTQEIVVMSPTGAELERIDIPGGLSTRAMVIEDDDQAFYLLRPTTVTKLLRNGTIDTSFNLPAGTVQSGNDIAKDSRDALYVVDDLTKVSLVNGAGMVIVANVAQGSPIRRPGTVASSPSGDLWSFDDVDEADFPNTAARLVKLSQQ